MTLKGKIGERGQVVIPKAIRDELALAKGSEIEFVLRDKVVTLKPAKDIEAIGAAIERYKGSRLGTLKSSGFRSVDDYMKAVRGR